LFLAIGWLSVIGGGTAFVALRGRVRGRGVLQWAMGIGLASLAGVPPLVGFASKEGVLAVAEESLGRDGWVAWVVLVALVVTVVLTAAYCARAWLVLTTDAPSLAAVEALEGQAESDEAAASAGDEHPTGGHGVRPVTWSAALTVSLLAVLTVVGALGLLLFPGGLHVGLVLALVSVVLVVVAALAVRSRAVGGTDPAASLGEVIVARADLGFGVDAAYVGIGRTVVALARVVASVDRDVVDAYPRAAARLTHHLGVAGDRVHRGAPSTGLVAVIVGVVVVGVAGVTWWH
ncbi:MAG: NADH-quinone oxidoreductase subunit L, partial [Lapillicoccus sp.]